MTEANMWLFCVVWHFAFGFVFFGVFSFILKVRKHGLPKMSWGNDRTDKLGYGGQKKQ